MPVQNYIAAIELDPDFTAQDTRISDLERDALGERARDASNRDLSEDRDVQYHGKGDTQIDGVIGDNDLSGGLAVVQTYQW